MSFLFALLVSTIQPASAQMPATECYRLQLGDDPIADEARSEVSKIWCYRALENPRGATLIFNVDVDGHTRPELSMLVEADGTTTHGSRLGGQLSIHKLKSDWSPLPAPLTPPAGAEKVEQPITPSSAESSDKALEVFMANPSIPQDIAIRSEGVYIVSVAQDLLPWRGYWFPHKSGRMHSGSNSPMAKFDRYVAKRSGRNPGAQRWEQNRHAYSGTDWAGHCNGWAAASIMNKEPLGPWTDPLTEVKFEVIDLKGILIERDYCPEMLFFGHRYRGGNDLGDIRAIDFHNTLTYYVGKLGKPILTDIRRDLPVENRVISGYKMNVVSVGENIYAVTADVTIHEYDSAFTNDVGMAPIKPRTYKYKIWTDAFGKVTKAQWISANPDFIWVPLAPGTCNHQNPAVDEKWVRTIGSPIQFPEW
ncbi:MAG: hypothetical protein V4692_12845 [Bdellovibrionota bacterium]